jgi:hypothetical protein
MLEKMAQAASGKDKALSAAQFKKKFEHVVTELSGGL